MTDKTYSTALAGLAIKNTPEPKNITFPDGSQLSFPVSGKASFSGDVEDSAKVFFYAVLRHRDTQLEAERQRADEYRDCIRVLADKLSVNALPNEIIEAVAELEAVKEERNDLVQILAQKEAESDSEVKGAPVPVGYRNKFTGMIWNLEHQLGAETDPLVYEPVYLTAPQKPASLPVGEIVTWSGTNRHMGITREVDFRFLRFDVMPGTKLYAIESESSDKKSDLLTRAEALAVETRALANQIQAGE